MSRPSLLLFETTWELPPPPPRVQNAVCCRRCIFNDPPRIIYESFSSPAVLGRLTVTACDVINHPSKMLCVPL